MEDFCHQNKQLGDRIFEKILSEKNIDAFNGAQDVFFMCCGRRMVSQLVIPTKCGLAITSLTTMLKEWKIKG